VDTGVTVQTPPAHASDSSLSRSSSKWVPQDRA
jgi:hypothetical protein